MAKSFTKALQDFSDKAIDNTEKIYRASALQVFTRVILASPVGNPSIWKNPPPPGYTGGSFRNNWFTTVERPSNKDNRRASKSGTSALREAQQVTLNGKGDTLYLTNNLPYAQRLERGWSSQAPAGFVRAEANNFSRYVDTIAKRLNR